MSAPEVRQHAPFFIGLSLLVAAIGAAFAAYNDQLTWHEAVGPGLSDLKGAKPDLEVGFCDSHGRGFFREQPADQLERWELPYDNGTHVVILWKNDKRVSGRNVSMYMVDVRTSVPVLNFFVGQFGGFPQDVCAPGGSKARNQVNVEGSAGACSPYGADDHKIERRTAFEIPPTLRQLAKWDIDVRVRGYGAHTPIGKPGEVTSTTWWCKVYRRPRERDEESGSAAGADNPSSSPTRPLNRIFSGLRRLFQGGRQATARGRGGKKDER